jgi:hypothetical protein
VFFLILAKDITGGGYGDYFFGSIFIIVSVLLEVDLFRKKMSFALPATGWRKHATLALMILVFSYLLLLFWAIPFSPFIQIPKYGFYEDGIMFAIGVYSLIWLLKDRKIGNPRG